MSGVLAVAAGVALVVGAVVALRTLWERILKPAAIGIAKVDQAVPVMTEFLRVFGDDTKLFTVLESIASEFRNGDGGSLRGILDELTTVATASTAAIANLTAIARGLEVNAKAAEKMTDSDRKAVADLAILIDRLMVQVKEGGLTSLRVEEAQAAIAVDLADSRARAEAVGSADTPAEPGAAADAAAVPPPVE